MKRSNTVCMSIGLAFFWPTLRRGGFSVLIDGSLENLYEARIAFLLFLVLVIGMALVLIWKWRVVESVLEKSPFVIPLISLAASLACSGLLITSQAGSVTLLLLILSILFFAAWFTLIAPAWGKLFSQTSGYDFFMPVVISFMISLGLSFVSDTLLSTLWVGILPVLCPLISGMFWYGCSRSLGSEGISQETVVSFKIVPLRQIILLTIFLMVGGFARGFLYEGDFGTSSTLMPLVTSVFSLGITLAIIVITLVRRDPSTSFARIWTFLAIVFFGGLFVVATAFNRDVESFSLGLSLIIAGRTCFNLLLWLFLSSIVAQNSFSAVVLFSLFYVIGETVASLVSYFLVPATVDFLGLSFSENLLEFALATAFVLVMLSLIFLRSGLILRRSGSESSAESPHAQIGSELVEKYALTEREADILNLILQGHTQKSIASTLFLSLNTVQSYSKNLYRKMNVHKKQDIIDLIANRDNQIT